VIDMSGGDNKTKKAATATPATPAAQPINMQQFPAFMPGQQGLLAEQMSAGYGAPVSENMGLLANLFKGISLPQITRPDQIAQYAKQIGVDTGKTGSGGAGNQYGQEFRDAQGNIIDDSRKIKSGQTLYMNGIPMTKA